jgi:8-oxo-dGTP pyrophosphatase MutT (NUDIX family)
MASVSVLILYDSDKRVYLQHRSDYKERWAGYWGTFGGGIEDGETVAQALEREIKEELSYRVKKPSLIYVQTLVDAKKYAHVEYYDSTQELIPCMNECQDARWVTIDEAYDLNLIPHECEALEKVRDFLQREYKNN